MWNNLIKTYMHWTIDNFMEENDEVHYLMMIKHCQDMSSSTTSGLW
jgi:hypothetical protein